MNRHATGCIATVLALGAALATCAPLAAAQALRDPTRPPVIFGRTGEGGIVSRRDAEWVLQSVLLSPERRYAIINGEVLSLGGSVAGAELIAIREGEVTLRAGGVLRTVRLFPDVDMRSEAVPKLQHPQQDSAGPGAREKSQAGAAEDTR
ncbi:MAG TPA: hypothetical protein VJT81_18645 [Burkholderiales bacterium]|nr:hypothetical protein [Burkholderiales bacterium]